ncbi:MAG: hypothetical protein IJE01_04710 [Clostridia bacterium]|nr:hypothetical protein [Clostridia bacterium]
MNNSAPPIKTATACFSGSDLKFNSELFGGAKLNAIFGGITCDLSNANIKNDCIIKANVLFGGIDIILPENVNFKVKSRCLFGGTSDKRNVPHQKKAPTVYIVINCAFGGVDVK